MDQCGNCGNLFLQGKVAGVQQVDLGAWDLPPKRQRAGHGEKRVVLAPDHARWRLAFPQVGLPAPERP